jgi:ribosomal protein S27AE
MKTITRTTVRAAYKAAGEPVFRKSPVAPRCCLRLIVAQTRRRFEHDLCGSCLGENNATVEQNNTIFCFSNFQFGIERRWQQKPNGNGGGTNKL